MDARYETKGGGRVLYCSKCGNKITHEDVYCSKCGQRLAKTGALQSPSEQNLAALRCNNSETLSNALVPGPSIQEGLPTWPEECANLKDYPYFECYHWFVGNYLSSFIHFLNNNSAQQEVAVEKLGKYLETAFFVGANTCGFTFDKDTERFLVSEVGSFQLNEIIHRELDFLESRVTAYEDAEREKPQEIDLVRLLPELCHPEDYLHEKNIEKAKCVRLLSVAARYGAICNFLNRQITNQIERNWIIQGGNVDEFAIKELIIGPTPDNFVREQFGIQSIYLKWKRRNFPISTIVPGKSLEHKISFYDYVSTQLAKLLPIRRRGLFSSEQVCEWVALIPTTEAAFCVGASLGISDTNLAMRVIEFNHRMWSPFDDLVDDYKKIIDGINEVSSLETSQITFERVFLHQDKPYTNKELSQVISNDTCFVLITSSVLNGIFWSYLNIDAADTIVKNWLRKDTNFRQTGIAGLSIAQHPMIESIDEATLSAKQVFHSWLDS